MHFRYEMALSAMVGMLCLFAKTSAARDAVALRADSIDRPIRYQPEGGDFIILNGTMTFNRPLYAAHTGGRAEAGDRPEFAFCTPGKGGVLRLGFQGNETAKWLDQCAHVVARYRAGSEVYEIDDPGLGTAMVRITAMPTQGNLGLILRAEWFGEDRGISLVWAYGGGTGERARNRFDLNDNSDMAKIWDLRPEDCAGAKVQISGPSFTYSNRAGVFAGRGPDDCSESVGNPDQWDPLNALLAAGQGDRKVVIGHCPIRPGMARYLCVEWRGNGATSATTRPRPDLKEIFDQSETYRRSVAERIVVDTPDPFINAIPGALCIAADDIWQPPTFMHGANAWRTPLLGWRGPYALDALSWHDRALVHLSHWAALQNTNPDIPAAARADPAKNLAENDWVMLHSNGNIPQTHYDMDLAFIDALYRHLLWTGDLDFARKMWPVIVRHLAWEKRCFDRDGLYEGYACIWASDGLEYNGGGAAHSSAYNYFHNLMAARVARLIGQDPSPFDAEASRIKEAMQKNLWLPDRGWYAEYKDLLGLGRVHPDAALWTIYHAIDCGLPDKFQAYQCLRYLDSHFAHIPVRGPGVPGGDFFVLPTSDWLPYEWSLNNVCMGENSHTALAYWEAGRGREAWSIFKGEILDATYMGICPGDFPNLSVYDAHRGESYRDFGDTVGITSRALIEGLFGIQPDALAGELVLRPGFPSDWDHASIRTPDLQYEFSRVGSTDRFTIEPNFGKPMALRLIRPARAEFADVRLNGRAVKWENVESVGAPEIEIRAAAAARFDVAINWSGAAPVGQSAEDVAGRGEMCHIDVSPAKLLEIFDPQRLLNSIAKTDDSFTATVGGTPGHRTAFAHVRQGDLSWWKPVKFEIRSGGRAAADSTIPAANSGEMIDLSGIFNDSVTRIFKNHYLSPRSPYCSLQIPEQGIGNWASFTQTAQIDDSGLRRAAGAAGVLKLAGGIHFRTPGDTNAKNIAFTSRWDNYPHEIAVPLRGSARHAYLLMAGSTNPMETDIDNGEIVVGFVDGTAQRVALRNPENWWPIEQDYFSDDYAFRREGRIPMRVCLGTGGEYFPHGFSRPRGGAATVVDFAIDPGKLLKSMTIRTLSNTVVIGLMSVTLER